MTTIPWSYRIYRWTWSGLDLLFPPVCGGCNKPGSRWCSTCQARVPQIAEPFCDICGIPIRKAGRCEKCQAHPPAYRMMRSWAVFDSPVRDAIVRMKYYRDLGLGDSVGRQMVDFVRKQDWNVDILVPVPVSNGRLKERGYNQVDLVARCVAYETGITYTPSALKKVKETRSQVGLNGSQRRENVSQAYQADPSVVRRKIVLLMDDVATTGSTVGAGTEALLSAGAEAVYAITIARALAHHDLNRV